MATHSSVLAGKIPWREEPGRLQSMGSQRVGHDWMTELNWICVSTRFKSIVLCPGMTLLVPRLSQNTSCGWGAWCHSLIFETFLSFINRLLVTSPLEKEMATHSSILAWGIPWMEEAGRLQSTGSQRVGHDWETVYFTYFLSVFLESMHHSSSLPTYVFSFCGKGKLLGSI